MAATIAWLDASREEQRRIREVVNLFSQAESRDELGIGQVRDAISDMLFPGTSTLHTRARYLLLIPWCYRAAAHRAKDAEDLSARAERNERRLILALHAAGAHEGLIGRNALDQIKTLPSSLYWSALDQWGVLVGEPGDELAAGHHRPEAEELVERRPRMWDVPPLPPGFPDSADRLDLDYDEAVWVQQKMKAGAEGSFLAFLLADIDRRWHELPRPWDVPVPDPAAAVLLEHARRFSLVIQGAALAYNLALARAYESRGLTQVPTPVARYEERIDEWNVQCATDDVAAWDLVDFWASVRQRNPRVSAGTRHFVEGWVDLLRTGARPGGDAAVALVSTRERRQKGKQSRLENDKLMRAWSGESGTGALTFRWSNVTRLLSDVKDGLDLAAA